MTAAGVNGLGKGSLAHMFMARGVAIVIDC